MIFSGRALLLDIEGTTSAVSYVYDIMFPFARRGLPAFLKQHWGQPALDQACEWVARDAGHPSLAAWCGEDASADARRRTVEREALRQMESDAKTTGLKQLQGLVWESGFASGELKAQLFDDVPPALHAWKSAGREIRIYSSGSVHAQRLFFGHTVAGNLLPLFSGHYDTTIGAKRDAESYRKIAIDFMLPAHEILFLSDVVAELDAARSAGMKTGLCLRPGNTPVAAGHGHPELHSFAEIQFAGQESFRVEIPNPS